MLNIFEFWHETKEFKIVAQLNFKTYSQKKLISWNLAKYGEQGRALKVFVATSSLLLLLEACLLGFLYLYIIECSEPIYMFMFTLCISYKIFLNKIKQIYIKEENGK